MSPKTMPSAAMVSVIGALEPGWVTAAGTRLCRGSFPARRGAARSSRRAGECDDAQGGRARHGAGARIDAQFPGHAGDVRLDRPGGETEALRDLAVGQSA